MLDILNWASKNPIIFTIIFFGTLIFVAFVLIWAFKIILKKQIEVTSSGIKVSDKKGSFLNGGKVSVNDIKDCVKFIEEKQSELVDDIHGIKDRFFKQSKDYAKSRIIASKNNIIEMYKIAYANVYFKKDTTRKISKEEVVASIGEISKEEIEQRRKNFGGMEVCSCKGMCKSGLTYFEAMMTQDFKPVFEKVYEIIEKNHLINKGDLEFDEEIRAKAIDLSTTLRNQVMSYEAPVDSEIAKIVMDRQMADLQSAITDGLRNSRILSKKKREIIKKVQENYETRKTEKLMQIFDKIGAINLENVIEGVGNDNKDHEGYDQDM